MRLHVTCNVLPICNILAATEHERTQCLRTGELLKRCSQWLLPGAKNYVYCLWVRKVFTLVSKADSSGARWRRRPGTRIAFDTQTYHVCSRWEDRSGSGAASSTLQLLRFDFWNVNWRVSLVLCAPPRILLILDLLGLLQSCLVNSGWI